MSAVTRVAALMRFRFAIVLSLALAFAGCNRESYSRSNSGFSSTEKKVLYDFRSDPVAAALPDAATAREVLSSAFPSYISDPGQCKSSQPRQVVATVLGAAEGSFTAAGLKQTVYLVAAAECGPPSAIATRRLLVFTADALTANVEAPIGRAILGAYDLDGDRRQELLLEESGIGSGEIIRVARLVEFDKNKLATVEDFGQTYDNTCDAGVASKSIRASVVYYLPPPAGQKARFTVELYRAACLPAGLAKQWVRVPAK